MLATDLRPIPVILCNGLLYALLGLVNHVLGQKGAGISPDGLYVIFALHFLRLGSGLAVAALAGALAYTGSPLGADQGMFMLAVLYLFFLPFREGWRRDQPFHLSVLAVILTLSSHALAALLALFRLEGTPALKPAVAYAVLAAVVAALAAPVWVELQRRLFLLFGVDLAAEPRRY